MQDDTLFPSFIGISSLLTHLHLSVRNSWLHGINQLDLPNVTNLVIRTVGVRYGPQPEPTITINAPQLEVGHFLLSDLRSIDFHGSTFTSTVKELLVSTPCYSLTTLGSPTMTQASGTCWTHQNFLTAYPEVEKAVITVHGLQALPSELPRVRWPKIKKLFLVFETDVADFISHIDMPAMEHVTLVYPDWRLIEGRSDSGESSDESSDEDDSNGDDSNGDDGAT